MKKSLLLILASLFAVFALAGCAEDSNNDTPAPTPTPTPTPTPLPDNISTLKGTYNIEFFYTDGGGAAVVTTDCSKVTEYVGSAAKQCADATKETVEHQGRLTLDVLADGSIKIISKIQMAGGAFDNTFMGQTAKILGANYNYTEYSVIPKKAISTTKINDPETGKNVKGVQGRNAVSITPYDAANNEQQTQNAAHTTYEFTYENGVLICKMKDTSSVVAADVVIRLKKTADTIEVFNEDEPFTTPVIDNFVNFYNEIIGDYSIDSLSVIGQPTDVQPTDYVKINSNKGHLQLGLSIMGGIYVYSEDPDTLMQNGLTVEPSTGNTKVTFSLTGLAEIEMTRKTPYNTAQGIGEKQSNISLKINNNKNITDKTTSFNVEVTQPSNTNKNTYNISVYNVLPLPSLPAGSYVGLKANPNFTANPADCSSRLQGTTSCKVTVSGLTAEATETPFIVVVKEVDANNTPTGVSALGLVKLSAASATPAQ